MARWLLNHLTSAALFGLSVGATTALGLSVEALHWRRRGRRAGGSDEMLLVTVDFVGLAYAILIGFVMVTLWQDQADAREAVSSEASSLRDIVSVSAGLRGDGNGVAEAVRDYCDVVVGEEWDLLATGRSSSRAEARAERILPAVTEIEATSDLQRILQSAMIESYREFTERRTERLALANVRLAGELWLLVLLASVIVVVLVAGFESDGKWHVGATLMIAATIGIVLFAIVALSYPFSGDVSVSSDPFATVARSVGGG